MDPTINNPHDKFAKEMLSQKSFAIIFLTEYLPREVKDCLDMETLTYSPYSFINESLEERFSYIVFKVQMKEQQGDCFVSILIENKANLSKYVSIQVLECSACADQVKAKEKIHPVIPILNYQGKENWKVEYLSDLLNAYPEALLEYISNYKNVFIGFFRLSDEALNQLGDIALLY
jgi:predicted transposase YdaD